MRFTASLEILKDMIPDGNDLPKSTYDAKKILCPIGMGYKKIHVCPNDFILFRNDHKELHACPICGHLVTKQEKMLLVRYVKATSMLSGRKPSRPPKWIKCSCAKQNGTIECGYYVVKFMFEIIFKNLVKEMDKALESFGRMPYNQQEINEV